MSKVDDMTNDDDGQRKSSHPMEDYDAAASMTVILSSTPAVTIPPVLQVLDDQLVR